MAVAQTSVLGQLAAHRKLCCASHSGFLQLSDSVPLALYLGKWAASCSDKRFLSPAVMGQTVVKIKLNFYVGEGEMIFAVGMASCRSGMRSIGWSPYSKPAAGIWNTVPLTNGWVGGDPRGQDTISIPFPHSQWSPEICSSSLSLRLCWLRNPHS